MKNKLCREIRMEILNFAETLSQSVVGRIGEFFRKAGEEIEEIKLNMAKTIQNVPLLIPRTMPVSPGTKASTNATTLSSRRMSAP